MVSRVVHDKLADVDVVFGGACQRVRVFTVHNNKFRRPRNHSSMLSSLSTINSLFQTFLLLSWRFLFQNRFSIYSLVIMSLYFAFYLTFLVFLICAFLLLFIFNILYVTFYLFFCTLCRGPGLYQSTT